MGGVLSTEALNGRLAMLRTFAEKRPEDPFPRYGLGIELKRMGKLAEAAEAFQTLIAQHADYVASYAPAGEVLTQLGRTDEARVVYSQGIEACNRKGDAHTRGNLEAALDALDG